MMILSAPMSLADSTPNSPTGRLGTRSSDGISGVPTNVPSASGTRSKGA